EDDGRQSPPHRGGRLGGGAPPPAVDARLRLAPPPRAPPLRGGKMAASQAHASVPGLVRDPDLAPTVGGHGDDVLSPIGAQLLAGYVLADHSVIATPPAAVETGLQQFDLDRDRLGVGQSVAHRRAPIVDGAIDLYRAIRLAIHDHAIARAAFVFGGGNAVATFDLGLDEDIESVTGAQGQLAAHRGVPDHVLADELRVARLVALIEAHRSGRQGIAQPAVAA